MILRVFGQQENIMTALFFYPELIHSVKWKNDCLIMKNRFD